MDIYIKTNIMYKGVIYVALSPSGKKYYGKSCQSMQVRKKCHNYDANNTNKQKIFLSALRKYGTDNFIWSIVETLTAPTREELRSLLNEREKHWIQHDKTTDKNYGYNMTLGGDGGGVFGRKLSEETKRRISESLKGKEYTQERKDNMSKNGKGVPRPKKDDFIPWCKGKTLSEEIRKKLSVAMKGKPKSEEHKKRLSESLKNKNKDSDI